MILSAALILKSNMLGRFEICKISFIDIGL